MDPLPKVTEASIRQHASSDSYHRGREYCEQKVVLSIVRRDQQLQAKVEGSQYEPYRVQITYDADGIAQALCTCPYDWGGWCKHIVATLLTAMHSPTTVEERPSMQTLLAGLEREQLQALLLHLVEQQPELADVVEAQVPRVRLQPAGDASTPQQRHTSVDPNVFRRQVRTILHSLDRMRSSEAYWHVGAVVHEVRQVLEQTQGFVAAGDGRNALAILEAITETYVADWVELDDSDGKASAFFEELGAVWTEAVLTRGSSRMRCEPWREARGIPRLSRWWTQRPRAMPTGRSRHAVNRPSPSCSRDNHSITITSRAGSRRHGLPIVLPVARRSGRPIWQS